MKLENYYKLRKETPEFFANRDLESKEIQASLDHLYYIGLPTTPDNCNLIYHGLSSYEPSHYVFDDAIKTYILVGEAYCYRNGPRSGTIFLDDLKGASFRHLFRAGINSIRKGIRFLEDGSPLEPVKAIHIFNTVPFIGTMVGEFD